MHHFAMAFEDITEPGKQVSGFLPALMRVPNLALSKVKH
jgi:hypothetical protein